MSEHNKDDAWAQHYHIAFMTGRYVGILMGLVVGLALGMAGTLLVLWLAAH